MKWSIPAKTFLLGEYVAITGGSAIILTTAPYFELSLTDSIEQSPIHPQSPAGKWWSKAQNEGTFLGWNDPYNERGGLGASSAQFLGTYWATCHLHQNIPDEQSMLEAYYQSSWSGEGLRPSGYDVIAQARKGCVYINKQKNMVQSYHWPFDDLSFLILHTGVKLATHQHLMNTTLPTQINEMSNLVDEAKLAFEQRDSTQLINAVNKYHQILSSLNLVEEHSLNMINTLKSNPEIVAIKGCGALGADTLLILTKRQNLHTLRKKMEHEGWTVLASEADLNC
ncbi:mevalonate kinase family protein [Legionella bononiensis]|uniref:Mevalonate kinase n=1 Tax=Legionella bononiensis TaxID=2793102 RepID=A0ABS1WE23_9GAMM|nr:hypothetical protein [Legionella bononiensis]MBL7479518.1 hypothetical protein [Legionella bononiensis]MBL7527608.1 hypothetical protein [Legionella bononiensis]